MNTKENPLSIAARIIIGSAVEEAIALLPDGYEIRIYISRSSVDMSLSAPDKEDASKVGECFDCGFSLDSLSDDIRDAVKFAIKHAAENKAHAKGSP